VYKDLLIQGTTVSEARHAPPGHVRAYDVRTGRQRWIFHTIPHPGEFGHDTWPADAWRTAGGANAWAGVTLDEARGIVFVPTGAPSVQYYGGDVPGANLFASTLVALDANTGRRRWHFQIVHHDIYDRDLPAPPSLITVLRDGRRVDAVAQVTKTGHVFVFDRETGTPLFPVEERAVPASPLAGERAWPTQPFPVLPAPFAPQGFTEANVTDLSPESRAYVLKRLRGLRLGGGPYNPPSVEGSVFLPFLNGGAEWGGAAVDPRRGILYVNANALPKVVTMRAADAAPAAARAVTGRALYVTHCASCHGADREGRDDRPALRDLDRRMGEPDLRRVLDFPRGFMPSFRDVLSRSEKAALTSYLLGREAPPAVTRARAADAHTGTDDERFRLMSIDYLLDQDGYPGSKPPWGTISAIDLNTGATLWQVPLGEYPELTARGLPRTGTENYGGPVVTAGGVIFIAGTRDGRFRALHQATGAVLWETTLPFAGYATPATYEVNGRQYVVIAAGGGKMGTNVGDAYVAFALPDSAADDVRQAAGR
jgi:quinoprotein glucose dehydrogenase